MILPKHILLVRTDSIGDVVLTLPMTGFLKEKFPGVKITFLCQSYTKPVVECCANVDHILEWNHISKLAESEQISTFKNLTIDTVIHVFPRKEITSICKRAKIKNRIATSHRLFTWLTCNIRVNFNRKKSDLHEAQLNFKLFQGLGLSKLPSESELLHWVNWKVAKKEFTELSKEKYNLILHPKSKGSAREWGLENFLKLIQLLPIDKFQIFISGTAEEGKIISDFLLEVKQFSNVTDLTGKYSLTEFISFIAQADALLAASTGPLHIAGLNGILAIGIFPPIRPMHPGRWKPLGKNTLIKVLPDECDKCKNTSDCVCMKAISPEELAADLLLRRK